MALSYTKTSPLPLLRPALGGSPHYLLTLFLSFSPLSTRTPLMPPEVRQGKEKLRSGKALLIWYDYHLYWASELVNWKLVSYLAVLWIHRNPLPGNLTVASFASDTSCFPSLQCLSLCVAPLPSRWSGWVVCLGKHEHTSVSPQAREM